jgi:sporulation protein YlmC with PRC-barrel domain
MLRSIADLNGYTIRTTDDEIGHVSDIYFDDEAWTVRYLVVDIGNWLLGRKVLISRLALGQPDWETQQFPVGLSRQQVEDSPEIDLARPVSRQHELELHEYYRWPLYWSVPGGVYYVGAAPSADDEPEAADDESAANGQQDDAHLRSAQEVSGYYIQALDGEIGHVEDFIVDDDVWVIRYLVIDTQNWWPGKKVLISPLWIDRVDWARAQVQVTLSREGIRNAPEYDPSLPVNRAYEAKLYDYYGRPRYWD